MVRGSCGVVVHDVADAEATNEFLVEFIASCCLPANLTT